MGLVLWLLVSLTTEGTGTGLVAFHFPAETHVPKLHSEVALNMAQLF